MLRIRHVSFWAISALLIGCGGDDSAPTSADGTGGGPIFGLGGSSGSRAMLAGASNSGGRSSAAGGSTSNGGTSSDGGAFGSSGGSGSGDGGASSAGGVGSGAGGSPGTGGSSPGGAANAGGGPNNLPPGSLCANDSNCDQSGGAAVCCVNVCKLAADCSTGTQFLPCNSAADCAAYGGGKVCCKASSGGQTMQYCTKPSGCPGTILP